MELIELKNSILESFSGTREELMQILDEIENDHAVFPFNEYELMLSTFIAQGKLTYDSTNTSVRIIYPVIPIFGYLKSLLQEDLVRLSLRHSSAIKAACCRPRQKNLMLIIMANMTYGWKASVLRLKHRVW